MTPDEFKAIRAELGLSLTGMAQALGVSRRAILFYQSGERKIPEPIVKLLATMK